MAMHNTALTTRSSPWRWYGKCGVCRVLVDLGGLDAYEDGVGISQTGVATASVVIRANPSGGATTHPVPFTQSMYPSEVLS